MARRGQVIAGCSRPRESGLTRRARSWRANRVISSRSRPSTIFMLPGDGGRWTRSSSQTSWSSTTLVRGRRLRPSGSATKRGSFDHFLHENPELKRAAYVWLTDFVGSLPTSRASASVLPPTTTPNDRADRALPARSGSDAVRRRARGRDGGELRPRAARIRAWTEGHYEFPGYVSGFDGAELADREKLRAELGYGPDEQVCIVTVGGFGVGAALLRRVIEAAPDRARAGARPAHDRRRRSRH